MRGMEIKKRHGSARTMALFACISVLIIGSFACDDQKDGSSGHSGKLRLSLTADTTSLKKGVNSNLTKVVSDEFEKFLTVEDYQIRIVTDKDTVKSYDRFDKMPSEIELPEGAYTIVASKGNDLPAAFENPYFEGSTDFTIKEGMSTPLDMTCTLGNARITLDCTDDFNAAYTDYSVGLKTKFLIDTILEIKKDETRPAYLQVAKEGTSVSFAIKLKKLGAEEDITYSGATPLTLQRRQNVRLVLKTDGEALEGIGLDILLDDSLTSVVLDDTIPDFMWKPLGKPELKGGNGLSEGKVYTMTAGSFTGQPQIEFAMQGGVGALYIKYWHDDENPVIYNLADKTDTEQALSEAHFSWVSYLMSDVVQGEPQTDKTLDKHVNSGIISLENAFNSLASSSKEDEAYTYHFQVYGVDATGQAVETETLNFTVIVKSAGSPNIFQNSDFPDVVEGDVLKEDIITQLLAGNGIKEATLTITCSNPSADKTYSFENDADKQALLTDYGIQIKKEAESKIVVTYPKEFSTHFAAPEKGEAIYSFKYSLKDKNDKVEELEKKMTVKAPVFNLLTGDGDAFAHRIMLRVDMPVGDMNKLGFEYKGGSIVDWTPVESPELTKMKNEDNIYMGVLKGLASETKYQIKVVYNKTKRVGEGEVTTEKEIGLLNGTFESTWTDKVISGLLNGAVPFTNKSLTSNDPEGWATVNDKTFANKSNVSSTYNTVPSSMKVDGYNGSGVRLRTVGWDNGAGNSGISLYHVAAGKLFLGVYSYNHSNNKDSYNYGTEFKSRPSKVSAMYKYTPYNSDSFKVWAIVENRDGSTVTQLGYGDLVKGGTISDWQELSFDIIYTNFAKKATHISLIFSSSSNCSDSQSEETSNLKDLVVNGEVDGYTHYEGSNLYIDNVTLIYE